MLRYRLCPPCGAVVLACGSLLLLQAGDGAARSALAQSREVLVGLSGRGVPATPGWPARGPAPRATGLDQQSARELDEALGVLALGNLREGRRRLEVLVVRYPEAAASDQARRELARLYALSADTTRSGSASGRPAHGPGGVKLDDDGGARLPVSLGPPAASGSVIPAQNVRIEERNVGRAAAQDFRLYVGDRVFFGDRSAEPDSRARSLLVAQARWLRQVPEAAIIVEGHADDQGGAAFNHDLAARRAQAVRDVLIAEGVEADRIALEVYGHQRPVALCSDGQCAAQNRRVVTVLRGARSAAETTAPPIEPGR
jgi:peptidoglycan-associated lipoprotein